MSDEIRKQALYDLLYELFSAYSLRRWIASLPDGDATLSEVPAAPASPAEVVHGVVEELCRRGMVNEEFFGRLASKRPGKCDKVQTVAALWGVQLEGHNPMELPPLDVRQERRRKPWALLLGMSGVALSTLVFAITQEKGLALAALGTSAVTGLYYELRLDPGNRGKLAKVTIIGLAMILVACAFAALWWTRGALARMAVSITTDATDQRRASANTSTSGLTREQEFQGQQLETPTSNSQSAEYNAPSRNSTKTSCLDPWVAGYASRGWTLMSRGQTTFESEAMRSVGLLQSAPIDLLAGLRTGESAIILVCDSRDARVRCRMKAKLDGEGDVAMSGDGTLGADSFNAGATAQRAVISGSNIPPLRFVASGTVEPPSSLKRFGGQMHPGTLDGCDQDTVVEYAALKM